MRSSTTALYDHHATLYDRATRLLDRLLHQQRQNLLAHARGRVLDVAVGTGKNLPYYPADCQVCGIDLATSMLQRAHKRAQHFGRVVSFVQGDAATLPYLDATFDTVVCTLAGCIFPDPVRVFQELRRVCVLTGSLLFLEHVRPPQPLLSVLADAITPVSAHLIGCHPNRPTVQYLQDAGLTIVAQTTSLGGVLVSVVAEP
jgi:ubiquinone/menaquinone biosynthesis C-methylase UbiE